MQERKLNILIIDDFSDDIMLYQRLLGKLYQCNFTIAQMAKEGLKRIKENEFDIIYLDYSMPDMNGVQLLEIASREKIINCPVVFLTGHGNEEVARASLKMGASDYISKSKLSLESMRRLTENALEKKEYERKLQQQHDELNKFVFTISHDLKSPINRMNRYAKLLKKVKDDVPLEQRMRYVDYIFDDSAYCIEFINTLYNYSQIGRSKNNFVPVNLNETVKRALDSLELEINQKSPKINIDTLPTIHADRIALIQLLQNIISNALKFNSGDNIKIDIWAKTDDPKYIELFIMDNGVGIGETKSSDIFKPFSKLDSSSEGFGLGMFLCQMIAQQHNGEISIASNKKNSAQLPENKRQDEGSIVTIKLPINIIEQTDGRESNQVENEETQTANH